MFDLIKDLFRDLLTQKTRMILTLLSIMWGTFSITSMLAIGEGLRINFEEATAGSGSNLLEITSGSLTKSYAGQHIHSIINLDKTDLESISNFPNVVAISPQYNFVAKLQHQLQQISQRVQAVDYNFNDIHQITVKPGGRFIKFSDIKNRRLVIVLGTKTTEELFSNGYDPIGEIVKINGFPFKVVGLMEKKPQIIASPSPDAFSNWIPFTTYELLANPKIINAFSITYQNPDQLDQLKEDIQNTIATNHYTDPKDKGIINFLDFSKQQQKINEVFIGMEIFLGLLGILTLVVAAVGITNVMLASIRKSTREIGIRMALGAKTYHIIFYYLLEAMLATFLGGLFGILLSIGLIQGLIRIPLKGRLIEAIGQPKPILSFTVMILVIIILSTIGFLAGLFPALHASKIDPAEALSYE